MPKANKQFPTQDDLHAINILKTLIGIGILGSLLSTASVLSSYHLIFDLLSHFRIQYIVLIFFVLCTALVCKRYKSSILLIGCLMVHVVDVARSQISHDTPITHGGLSVRVMTSNLLANNLNHQEHIEYLLRINPDIIVFQEFTNIWQQGLSEALHEYKHRVSVPLDSPFGIALYSKLPLQDTRARQLVSSHRPSVEGTIFIDGRSLKIIGAHPPPPVSKELYAERNEQLVMLAKLARSHDQPLLILGDLNITPWSAHFRRFLQEGRLSDARRGFGILATWPSSFWPLRIPIDHVLISKHVRISDANVSEVLSSDHLSLWADIHLNNQE